MYIVAAEGAGGIGAPKAQKQTSTVHRTDVVAHSLEQSEMQAGLDCLVVLSS